MSSEAGKKVPGRAGRRAGDWVFVVIVVVLMVAAAYYQDELRYFFQLQAWSPGRPAQTVVRFLEAGRAGKRAEADRCIDGGLFRPLEASGKFVGYQLSTTIGTIEYRFAELAGPGEIRPVHSELVFKGPGAAMVTVPDAGGRPIDYRLEMRGGAWAITEIRGGRLRR